MSSRLGRFFENAETGTKLIGAYEEATKAKELAHKILETASPGLVPAFAAASHVVPFVPLLTIAFCAVTLVTRRLSRQEKKETEAKLEELLKELQSQGAQGADEQAKERRATEYIANWVRAANLPTHVRESSEALLTLFIKQSFDDQREELQKIRNLLEPERYSALATLYRVSPEAVSTEFAKHSRQRTDSLAAQIGELLVQQDARPDILLPISSGTATGTQSLLYSERFIPVIGRSREQQELREFLDGEERFRWWLWHGDGGEGKSRLALELCLEAAAQGWDAGFVRSAFPTRFGEWEPIRPTLLVVDYASRRPENLGAALRAISTYDGGVPIRLLLLERQFAEQLYWVRRALDPLDPFGGGVPKKQHASPRLLLPLDPDHGAFLGVFERAYEKLGGTRLTDDERRGLAELFREDVFQRRKLRPLYALVAAIAGKEGGLEQVMKWQSYDLLAELLKRESRVWDGNGAGQHDVNAAFYATAVQGLSVEAFWELKLALPHCIADADAERAAGVTTHTAVDGALPIPGMQPDLVGEAFLIGRLEGSLYSHTEASAASSRLLDRALETPTGLVVLGHLAEDFITRPVVYDAVRRHAGRLPIGIVEKLSALAEGSDRPAEERAAAGSVLKASLVVPSYARCLGIYQDAERLRSSHRYAEAIDRYAAAIEASGEFGVSDQDQRRLRLAVLLNGGKLAAGHGRIADARVWLEASLSYSRTVRSIVGDTPEVLRDLSISLDRTADVMLALGQAKDALQSYQESLDLCRTIHSIVGDTPGALRDLSVSLDNTANVMLALGQAKEALQSYQESLDLCRTIHSIVGDTPGALRDLSVSLEKTANVMLALGQAKEALQRYEESLDLCRTIRSIVGETPEALRDLSISLNKTADVMLALGQAKEALQSYQESLDLRRTIRLIVGDTPEALRDLSISLNKTADVMLALGQAKEALQSYQESLDLCRTIRLIVGDTPQSLRDLSISLNKTADVMLALGQAKEALQSYQESLDLCRTVRSIVGDTPGALRDEMVSWYKLALVRTDSQRACAELATALEIAQVLVESYPDIPQYANEFSVLRRLVAEQGCI